MQRGEGLRSAGSLRYPGLIVAGLAIAYSPKYINPMLQRAGLDWGPQGPPAVILWNWLAVGVLAAVIVAVEGRGFASIALKRPSGKDLEWAATFWGVATGANWILNTLFPPPPSDGLGTLLDIPLPVLVLLILTTATTEEVLYRGYPIERIRELTGRLWPGVAFSAILFVIPHLTFFGPQWLLYNGTNTLLIYILYVWRRNLWACMLLHLLGNALILIPAAGIAG